MKRKFTCLLIIFLITILNACGLQKEQTLSGADKVLESSEEENSNPAGHEENMTDSSGYEGDISDPSGEFHPFEPYAVESLTEEQRSIYEEMCTKILDMEDFSYPIASSDNETILSDILAAWDALQLDMPQIKNYFWLDETFDSDGNLLSMDSRYYCVWDENVSTDKADIQEGLERFDEVCDEILALMPEDGTTLEKYRYLAAAVSERLEYDYDFEHPAIMCPYGIVDGYAVCVGYAEIYQYLCMRADLWCHTVTGMATGYQDELHVWNIIWLDDGTYYVDITWADELGEPGDEEWERYFVLTQEELMQDHEILDGSMATGI